MKIYSALYNDAFPLDIWYPQAEVVCVIKPEDLTTSGFLVVWGGEDIHPSLYRRPIMGAHVGKDPSRRDVSEWNLMQRAISLGLPILGICRGAQMACAAAGGILIQDVSGHGSGHAIKTVEGDIMFTSSMHHQMMFLKDTKHTLVAWSHPQRSDVFTGLNKEEESYFDGIEPEVVLFPTIKCLAVQGHPEWLDAKCPFNQYVQSVFDKLL